MELPFAKTVNYWKTGQTGVETLLDKAEKLLESVGGSVNLRMIGRSGSVEGISIGFVLDGDNYRIDWPVLPVDNQKDKAAAQRQAATFVLHDIKARCMKIKILPTRVIFIDALLDEAGRNALQRSENNFPLLSSHKK